MFNKVIDKVFTISPLLAEMQRRDMVFKKQADYLMFKYTKHTGPLSSEQFTFNHLADMKQDIYSDEPNNWVSRERAALVTQSHLDVIKYAKDSELKNVCIFENDVLFHHKFHETFNLSWWNLPEDWDILYLGAYYNYEDSAWVTQEGDDREPHLFKVEKGSLCSHAYVLNQSAINRFSDDFSKAVEDGKYFIIDQFLGYATEFLGYKTYGILPKLVEQGYCGTPSLTEGLSKESPEVFDFGEVIVREPHFDDNKSSDATREDYTKIIHKNSSKDKEFQMKVEQAKKSHQKTIEKIKNTMYVTEEEQDRRLEFCNKCPHFTEEGRCAKCGCVMATKTKLTSFSCPIGNF